MDRVTGPDGKVIPKIRGTGENSVRTIYTPPKAVGGSYGYRAQKVVYQPLSEFTSKTWTTFSLGCWKSIKNAEIYGPSA